jgi:protein O-GlcNAc transferase
MPTLHAALRPLFDAIQRRDFAAAEPLARAACADFPDHEAAWLLAANLAAAQGRLFDLESIARAGLARFPMSFDLSVALATALRSTLRPAEAAGVFRAFADALPEDAPVHVAAPALAALAQQLNYTPGIAPADLLAAHQRFGRALTRAAAAQGFPAPPAPRAGHALPARAQPAHAPQSPRLQSGQSASPAREQPSRHPRADSGHMPNDPGLKSGAPSAAPAPPSNASAPLASAPQRVGLLSADLCRHSVAHFLLPIVEHWPPSRDTGLSLTLYSAAARPDAITQRFRSAGHAFHEVAHLPPLALAQLIRQHGIDLLIECNGPADGSRLAALALRPAPIQLTYCGYPATTGLPSIAYRLVDTITDGEGPRPEGRGPSGGGRDRGTEGSRDQAAITSAPNAECPLPNAGSPSPLGPRPSGLSPFPSPLTTETLLPLDPCFLCYTPLDPVPMAERPPREPGRPITLVCFNQLYKLNPELLDLWARILRALPDARLLLKAAGLDRPDAQAALRRALEARGVAADRLAPLPWTPDPREHLGLYYSADLALDTFPYHGTTTTCEALLMGTPVVTLAGDRHASRVGASLLSAVGCPELIAHSAEDYVERAVALARDPARLAQYHATLPARMRASPLMDAPAFARRFAAALRSVSGGGELTS